VRKFVAQYVEVNGNTEIGKEVNRETRETSKQGKK
jgi:hypothetical protein